MADTFHVGACRDGRRKRDRLIPVLSLVVACLFVWGTRQVATRVREYNSNRAVGGLIVAGMMATQNGVAGALSSQGRTGLPWLSLPNLPAEPTAHADSPPAAEPAEPSAGPPVMPLAQLTRASSAAEMIVYAWERMLYLTAAVLAIAGLIGICSRQVRGPHLVGAGAVLLSTIGTLVGMRLLMDPSHGAFHGLPLQSYLLAAALQCAYGLVLLLAFARRPAFAVTSVAE